MMGLKISKNAPFWAILVQIMRLIPGKPLELRIQKNLVDSWSLGTWAITTGSLLSPNNGFENFEKCTLLGHFESTYGVYSEIFRNLVSLGYEAVYFQNISLPTWCRIMCSASALLYVPKKLSPESSRRVMMGF